MSPDIHTAGAADAALLRVLVSRLPGPVAFRIANAFYRRRLWHRTQAVRTATVGGARFELEIAEWPQAQAFLTGRYAEPIVEFIAKIVQAPAVVVDAGAHVGLVTFQLAIQTGARVHAFEPHPAAVASFHRNWRLNEVAVDVALNECALAEKAGTVSFDTSTYQVREGSLKVAATTLDDYLRDRGIKYVDAMKIDVEGYEMNVLRGSSAALREHRIGCVVIELADVHLHRAGSSSAEVIEFFRKCGYEGVNIGAGVDLAFRPRGSADVA